jgi:trans-aconitate methyltransferase
MDYNQYAKVWSSKKSSSTHYAHLYLEKPAMQSVLNGTKYGSILDLGCGSGEDTKWLQNLSSDITGIDSSFELIAIAEFDNPESKFIVHDLNNIYNTDKKFDLIFSSLTFHYIEDWNKLFTNIYQLLNNGGKVVFSTHHPIKWGSEVTKSKESNQFLLGYTKNKDANKTYKVYGDYLNQYKINEKLFQQLEITHYNRPLSEMFRIFQATGFEVLQFLEPKAVEESKAIIPDFYEVHTKIPLFVVWELRKKS